MLFLPTSVFPARARQGERTHGPAAVQEGNSGHGQEEQENRQVKKKACGFSCTARLDRKREHRARPALGYGRFGCRLWRRLIQAELGPRLERVRF